MVSPLFTSALRLWVLRQTQYIIRACIIEFCQRNQNVRRQIAITLLISEILRLCDTQNRRNFSLRQIMILPQISHPSIIADISHLDIRLDILTIAESLL